MPDHSAAVPRNSELVQRLIKGLLARTPVEAEQKIDKSGVLATAANYGMADLYIDQLPYRAPELTDPTKQSALVAVIRSCELNAGRKLKLITDTLAVEPAAASQVDRHFGTPLEVALKAISPEGEIPLTESKIGLNIVQVILGKSDPAQHSARNGSILLIPLKAIDKALDDYSKPSVLTQEGAKALLDERIDLARKAIQLLQTAGAKLDRGHPHDAEMMSRKSWLIEKGGVTEFSNTTPALPTPPPVVKVKKSWSFFG